MGVVGTRTDAVRVVAVGALAVASLVALWHFPGAFLSVSRDAGDLGSASALERELMGARGFDVDTRVFVEARRLIPEDATYAVVTGPDVQVSNATTLPAVAPFAAYWLLPRQQVPWASQADWVLSYGGDLDALGLDYEHAVDVAPGIALAEVRR